MRPLPRRALPRRLPLLLAALLLAGVFRPAVPQGRPGAGPSGAGGAPSLLLITIDTWRWDYLGASGAGKVETPNLDRLAREGLYEREVVTPYPLTTPAHASLFTGLQPMRHGVLDCGGFSLPPSVPTLAESFLRKGYSTAAFVAGEVLKARYGLDRGFQRYDDTGMESRSPGDWQSASRDGARVVDAALAYLAAGDGASPSFLWVHLFDAHTPYRDHAGFTSRYPGRPYAAEVAYVDSQIGRLLAGLPRGGRPWRIVVIGDHGEGLGDHGEMGHGYGLYRSTLHVPLILSPAPDPPLVHARPWSLVDLVPTLEAWFGLPPLPGLDGENLMAKGAERVLPTLTLLPAYSFGVRPVVGARTGTLNYLEHRAAELYDLSRDPGEVRNLKADPAYAGPLAALRGAASKAAPADAIRRATALTWRRPTPAELRALAGLGYIAGGERVDVTGLPPADLKKLLRDSEELDRERERALQTGDRQGLRERFGRLSREYPRSAFLIKNYAALLLEAGDMRGAAEAFKKAVSLDPGDSESMTNWGSACMQLGEDQRARVLLEASLELNGADPLAHKNLAILLALRLGQPGQALPHARRYLELFPSAPDRKEMEAWIRALERESAVPAPQAPRP